MSNVRDSIGIGPLPKTLPVIAVRKLSIYPSVLVPLKIGREKSVAAVKAVQENAVDNSKLLALIVTQKDDNVDNPDVKDLYEVGTVGLISRMDFKADGKSVQFTLQGICRAKVTNWVKSDDYFEAEVTELKEEISDPYILNQLFETLKQTAVKWIDEANSEAPQDIRHYINTISDAGSLCNILAHHLSISTEDKQNILEINDLVEKTRQINILLNHQSKALEIKKAVTKEMEKRMEKTHKEAFLMEQRRQINKQLGEEDDDENLSELKKAIEDSLMKDEVKKSVLKEFSRLKRTHPMSAEYAQLRQYLEYITELPWGIFTEDKIDIKDVTKMLNVKHYGLEEVKKRILEFLSVRKIRGNLTTGPILCLVGPPGVGKTSLARSISDAIGRKFIRISLGGVHDEAEVRGHRRTYVGAMAGKIIKALHKVEVNNPVVLLDELDKIGSSIKGDPAAALLEVLDPEQNKEFLDHYIDQPVDLSNILFIATANTVDNIYPALKDRLEIIPISGYTENEKFQIAKRYIIPEQVVENGLGGEKIIFPEPLIRTLIRDYTKEAGVRRLSQKIAKVLRSIVKRKASNQKYPKLVSKKLVEKALGKKRDIPGKAEFDNAPGVATGLAWTPAGGDLLFIESVTTPGKGRLKITGQAGQVMQESAEIALACVKARSKGLGLGNINLSRTDINIHFPEGATPKDGPSAGIALVTSLASLLSNKPIPGDLAMTGEISLRGKVLPIGGLKEKLLAAKTGGIKKVLIPEKNKCDYEELSKDVVEGLEVIFVSKIDEVMKHALGVEIKPDMGWANIESAGVAVPISAS